MSVYEEVRWEKATAESTGSYPVSDSRLPATAERNATAGCRDCSAKRRCSGENMEVV